MTYATVMVSMALDRSNDARLEIAGQLAERFGALVIGVTAAEFSPPLYFTDGEQAQKILGEGQAAIRNRIAKLEAQFRAAMQNRAMPVEWRCAEDFPTRFIVQQARAADIIIVGGGGRDALGAPLMQAVPGDLLMLVVPETSNWLDMPDGKAAAASQGQGRQRVDDGPLGFLCVFPANQNIARDCRGRRRETAGMVRGQGGHCWLLRHGVLASGQVPDECG